MKQRWIFILYIASGLWAWTACNSDDDAVFRQGNNIESKPSADLLPDLKQLTGSSETSVAMVKYNLTIESNSGAKVCKGEVTLEIMSDFTLNFPESYVDCVSMRLNLAAILGMQTEGGGTAGMGKMTHDGKVLAIETIGGATFDPPRPMLLGPIVQQEGKYRGFQRTQKHKLKATDDEGKPVTGHGTFTINVINDKTTYKYKDISFENVIHWEMTSDFDTSAKYGLTFKKWTWYWNTNPIMIPGLEIVGSMKDFMTGASAEQASELTGDMKIKLYVKEYKMN